MEKSTEYPKHLYKNGDRNAADRVVANDEEEKDARADGFSMLGEKKKVEKKEYTDGTSATGTAPLPAKSPDGAPEKPAKGKGKAK